MSTAYAEVRLVEWNIAMSLQKKAHALAGLAPTVAVLPECADLSRSMAALESHGVTDGQWIGSQPSKGLGIFTFGGWTLSVDDSYDPGYQWLLPLHVTDGRHLVRLLAVWEMNRRGKGYEEARTLGSARASLEHYKSFLSGSADAVVVSGDFNNSTVWDTPRGSRNFGALAAAYRELGLVSAYHHVHGSEFGAELHPTHWWRRNVDTTYHIDYTFTSVPEAVTSVTLGSHEQWISHSDHSPMTVCLELPQD